MPTGPTFELLGRVPSPVAYESPLPPTLREGLSGAVADRHANLAAKFRAKTDQLVETTTKLEQARQEDERALARALEAGSKVPKSKAAAVEEQIAQLRHESEILGSLLIDASADLLADASVAAPEMERKLGERVVAAVDEARAHLQAALEAFALSDRLSGEQVWCSELTTGSVTVWTGQTSRLTPKAASLTLQALQQVEQEPREAAERVAARQREEEALNTPQHLAGVPGRSFQAAEPETVRD